MTNNNILDQATCAMDILEKYYPDEDHVLVYDNAKTHLKCADNALSACHMPKFPSNNFFVECTVVGTDGKLVYSPNRKILKEKIQMGDTILHDGSPQSLYYPPNHPLHPGSFKEMLRILLERGYTSAPSMLSQCKGFKCPPGAKNCCYQCLLFSEPDFNDVESILEAHCKKRNIKVLFLPKFHPELNPIEQCWGFSKRKYCEYPRSSKEDDLVRNVIKSLQSVSLTNIRKYVHSYDFGWYLLKLHWLTKMVGLWNGQTDLWRFINTDLMATQQLGLISSIKGIVAF